MRCANVQELLVLYLAGELASNETSRIKDHLAQCSGCKALAKHLTETQGRTAAALLTDIEPPVTLDARVMTTIRAQPVRQSFWTQFLPTWSVQRGMAAAAALGGVLLLGLLIGSQLATESVMSLANLGVVHNRLSAGDAPPDLHSTDTHQLRDQLTSLVHFPVQAADLKSEGASLIGGRRILVGNVAVAALHYNWEGHPISLFEMDAARQTPSQLRQLEREPDSYYVHKAGDLAYVAWHSGKTDCVMVARSVPMHLLFHLACRACERQQQSHGRIESEISRARVVSTARSVAERGFD